MVENFILINSHDPSGKVFPESAIRNLSLNPIAPSIKASEIKGGRYKFATIFFRE